MRAPNDHYPTPPEITRAILPHLPRAQRYLDLGCGDGAILDVLAYEPISEDQFGAYTRGIEIDPGLAELADKKNHDVWIGDLRGDLDTPLARGGGRNGDGKQRSIRDLIGWADLTCMNPPFKHAELFVRLALTHRHPRATVAALLRNSFVESMGRVAFFREFGEGDMYCIPNRIDFTRGVQRVCPACAGVGGRPTKCKRCSSKGRVKGGHDMAACAWFVWSPGRVGRRYTLDPIVVAPLETKP